MVESWVQGGEVFISRNIETKWSTYWNVKWLNETPGLHFERSYAKTSAS
jgi:hypothetical protein